MGIQNEIERRRQLQQVQSSLCCNDYDETFAPVVKYVSLRTVLAIANQYNMDLHQMDVNSAYLNGDIDAEIYMNLPEAYVDPLCGSLHLCQVQAEED